MTCEHYDHRNMNDGPSYLCTGCGAEGYVTAGGVFYTWAEVEELLADHALRTRRV